MLIKKILMIDDCEPDQFLNKALIELFAPEIEVIQAYDGREALIILNELESPPDIIFLDINMPVMNGHEFLEAYTKENSSPAPVFMLTSSEQKKDMERLENIDVIRTFIPKPLDLEKLKEIKEMN